MLAGGTASLGSASPAIIKAILAGYGGHDGGTPPPPPPPPPPSSSDGGTTPDYNNILAQDPVYQQAQADEQAAIDAARAQRDAETNQALIQFGAVPDIGSIGASLGLTPAQISMITGGINDSTAALANQYTSAGDSVLGRLNHAHDQALNQLRASLAARGMLESGSTGVGVGLENQNFQQGLSQAYQQLLSGLLGYQNDFAGSQRSAEDALRQAAGDAYDRGVQSGAGDPGTGSRGFSAPPDDRPSGTSPTVQYPAPPKPKAPKPPALPNPYSTGQKRFG